MNAQFFTLETQVSPEITIRTVEERDRYLSYGYQHWHTEEILSVYRDELSAREGHLRWVKHDWMKPKGMGNPGNRPWNRPDIPGGSCVYREKLSAISKRPLAECWILFDSGNIGC